MSKQQVGKKKQHPLGWTDKELAYLASLPDFDMSHLYRAMNYKLKKGNSVPKTFRDHVEQLRGES